MRREDLTLFSFSVIGLFVIGIVLQQLRAMLLPFSFAVLLSIMFHPLHTFMKKKNVPTALSLVAVLAVACLVFLSLGSLLYASAGPVVDELPRYQAKFNQVLVRVADALIAVVQKLGLQTKYLDLSTLLGATTVTAEVVSSTLRTFVDFLGKAALVLAFMLFMLSGTGTLSAKVRRAFRPEDAEQINDALGKEHALDLEGLLQFGASPRATLALVAAARAHAFLRGRGFVTPEDIKAIGADVLRHRLILSFEAEAESVSSDEVVQRVFDAVEVP